MTYIHNNSALLDIEIIYEVVKNKKKMSITDIKLHNYTTNKARLEDSLY